MDSKTLTVDLLRQLVDIDSSQGQGGEVPALTVLEAFFNQHGIASEIHEYRPGNANLTAHITRGSGPTFLLNSHIDVVPAGAGWSTPPFASHISDDRMYGRGTADAKGSLAAMAVALVELAQRDDWNGQVIFSAVGDEEVGSSGARALIERVQADACLVGEPTNLKILAAHKGSLRPRLQVTGTAAHAATPWQGVNAIEGAGVLLSLIAEYSQSLREKKHPLTGHPTATPVLISGGEAPNAVPESCVITVDRRLVPGETGEDVTAEFEALIQRFNEHSNDAVARIEGFAESTGGPSETSPESPLVVSARRALTSLGLSDELGGLMVNCDMATFRAHGIPTIVFGPGTLEVMHAKDEYVSLEQLVTAKDAYVSIIQDFLGAE